MTAPLASIRNRLDQTGIALSALCLIHCLGTIVLVSALGLGGQWLLSPQIHRFGLMAAIVIAGFAIGWGAWRHRRLAAFLVAMIGLSFMALALVAPHGLQEAGLTIVGVALVSLAHIMNLRGAR